LLSRHTVTRSALVFLLAQRAGFCFVSSCHASRPSPLTLLLSASSFCRSGSRPPRHDLSRRVRALFRSVASAVFPCSVESFTLPFRRVSVASSRSGRALGAWFAARCAAAALTRFLRRLTPCSMRLVLCLHPFFAALLAPRGSTLLQVSGLSSGCTILTRSPAPAVAGLACVYRSSPSRGRGFRSSARAGEPARCCSASE